MGKPSKIVVQNKEFRKIAESYYSYVQKLGYIQPTCRSKYLSLTLFLHWLERQGITKIQNLTTKEITSYYQYISTQVNVRTGNQLHLKTSHSHMINVREMLVQMQSQGQISSNPFNTLKFPYPISQTSRVALLQEEIKSLYEATENDWERAMLSLAYGCGLRANELVECNCEDIKIRDKILIVQKGKGNKRRVVPISSGVAKDLQNYYYNERIKRSEGRDFKSEENAFMLHIRGGRVHQDTFNKYLKRIIERTKNQSIIEKNITLHNLRHSIATHLLQQGMSVEQVRDFLGHSQLESTQIYTHVNQQQLKKLIV